jgi:hypothetical protein
MIKKLKAACDFEGRPGSFQVWVGRPAPGFHPLRFQAAWLSEERGGRLSEEVVEQLEDWLSACGQGSATTPK